MPEFLRPLLREPSDEVCFSIDESGQQLTADATLEQLGISRPTALLAMVVEQ